MASAFRQAAIEILAEANKPLHYKEITEFALKKGLLPASKGETPDQTMNEKINRDIKRHGEKSVFKSIGEGHFGLNPNYGKERNTLYTGKAGEHLVLSELLFRGFNANILSVDDGLDIAARKGNKHYYFQVKTKNRSKNNTYPITIGREAYEKYREESTYYILVLRDGYSTTFLILPYKVIEEKIRNKSILLINKDAAYRLTIRMSGEDVYLNKTNPVSKYKNNWNVIK